MSKKLLLVIAALSSFSVLADTPDQSNIGQFDKMSFCTYEGKPYSIGSPLPVGKDLVKCIAPGINKDGYANKSSTAHWE
ncbi:hypothetical protein C0J08_15215 [Marinomonas sp. CT5]|uniref:hypothetical protein n=1 Tax=Marinomonas sp. CT5 TaxID=2066133 RepID=UPI0017C5D591|nr:hypothetical protein [Marinomonas sp. CT5]NVK75131.1 hypothetical protein [Oceanospirillaceae bacterium]QUX96663.1 hypothetical protein C0J08_15215 [Marinomonas sp. CT5]